MPILDGVKVACAPCIRGHRSTKCNHAADRLMIPVRKPGRPLSACACPPGQTCNCGGSVKVAIPRKKNCNCETNGGIHDEGHEDAVKPEVFTPAPTPSDAPASPTRPRPFRIEKSASISRHGLPKSISPTHLDRIDPASVNILPPFNPKPMSMPINGNDISTQGYCTAPFGMDFSDLPATGYQQSDVLAYETKMNTMASIPSQIGHVQVMSAPGMLGTQPMSQNGAAIPPTNGSRRSCCAPKPSQVAQPQVQTPAPQPTPTPRKSCCGGESRDIDLETNIPMQPAILSNGGMGPQFPVEQMSGHQQQKHPYGVPFPQGTIYYPPNYGTMMDPITPAIWANLQLQQSFQEQPDGGLPFAGSIPITPHAGDNQGPGVSHQCGCGPGCSCIGCVSHPFNSQTLQYVNEAWNYDINQATADGNGQYATDGRTLPTPPPNQGQNHELETMSPQLHPQQAQTPSDASGLSDEQPLSASDFLWVNMPCQGDLASCLCGDDCACVGCTIHNSQLLGLNFPEQ